MTMTSVVVVGAGGLGRMCVELIEELNAIAQRFEVLGFLDDNASTHGTLVDGYPVLGGLAWIESHPEAGVVVGVGKPAVRKRIVGNLRERGATLFPSIIHPTALVSTRAAVQEGAVIRPYCIVQPSATVGSFASLGTSTVIGHDCEIGAFVSTGPHVCVVGGGTVGECCDIGSGTAVLPDGPVGRGSTVGANATVTRPLPEGSIAVGSPARVIRLQQDIE